MAHTLLTAKPSHHDPSKCWTLNEADENLSDFPSFLDTADKSRGCDSIEGIVVRRAFNLGFKSCSVTYWAQTR